jgi:hypothetical protein
MEASFHDVWKGASTKHGSRLPQGMEAGFHGTMNNEINNE